MISQQLLRVPFYGISPEMEMAEAFAYCYAATWGTDVIHARMQESYLRAWDHDSWEFVPTQLAGRPGYVKAYFSGDYRGKVVVAIRGMTSFASLLPIRGGLAASRFPVNNLENFNGLVFDLFSAYATTTYNELIADTVFMNHAWNPLRRPVVLAGFSMGAAVAELVAAKLRRNYPGMTIRLIKFASPKIGNEAWLSNPEVALPKTSVYMQDDPIQAVPFNTIRAPTFASPNVFCPFEPDADKTIFDLHGNLARNSPQDFVLFVRQVAQVPAGLPSRGNLWWMHRWETYRYALCSMAQRVSSSIAARLRYLEYPGDNIWGRDFDRMDDWTPLIGEASPAPADFNPNFDATELRAMETIRPREATLEYERDTSGTSEGGSWGGGNAGPSESGGFWGGGNVDSVDSAGAGGGGSWAGPGPGGVMDYLPPATRNPPAGPAPRTTIMRRTRARRTIVAAP